MVQRPNILLFIWDAVRYDHLSCCGYYRDTTPNLDRVAKEGYLFRNAFATSAWTAPSIPSVLTGQYPSMHGVLGYHLRLNEDIGTLAQALDQYGYRTMAITANSFFSRPQGLDKGFGTFLEDWRVGYKVETDNLMYMLWRITHRGGDIRTYYSIRKVKSWLREVEEPFFLVVHWMNAHCPYHSPYKYREKFVDRAKYSPSQRKAAEILASSTGGYGYMAGAVQAGREHFDLVQAWYDGCIAYMDQRFGEIVKFLEKVGLFDDTVIMVTADHGENFGEHGLANHQFCLYDTLLHVPLIMSFPQLEGGVVEDKLVSHVDIVPTVLDLIGLPYSDLLPGISLVREESHRHIFAEYGPPLMTKMFENYYPGFDYSRYDRMLKSIRTRTHKLIVASDGEEELYDLTQDPSESHNLIEQELDLATHLREILSRSLGPEYQEREGLWELVEDDDKVVERRLRALGYL